jgi:hypothetical protein
MSELVTVAGIIALGVNGGLLQAYLSNPKTSDDPTFSFVNVWLPTTINVVLTFTLIWGLLSSGKASGMKTLYVFLILIFSGAELYYVFLDKNSTSSNYNPVLAQVILFASSIFKLFLVVTLHCEIIGPTSTDFFSKLRLPRLKPKEAQVKKEKEPELDDQKAMRLFSFILNKTGLSEEAKLEYDEKFIAAMREADPWQKTSNLFSNVLQKVPEEELDVDEKSELRNKFRLAMGRSIKGGR